MTNTTSNRPKRDRHLQWVNANELNVNPAAQREFRPAWAKSILADWDLEKFQEPHVNKRDDGSLYIMEGQHGTWAYREKYGEEGEDYLPIQVWMYSGLSERQEADFFLSFNNKKAIPLMEKFKAAVTAGREVETDIDRIVRARGCNINNSTTGHAISAVAALQSIYRAHGARTLGDTVGILRDSFGDGGYERGHLLGVSMVLARYGVEPADVTKALLSLRGGSKGLVQRANMMRESMGCTITDATAGAIVELLNKTRRGAKRLPPWFATSAAA